MVILYYNRVMRAMIVSHSHSVCMSVAIVIAEAHLCLPCASLPGCLICTNVIAALPLPPPSLAAFGLCIVCLETVYQLKVLFF